jgi:hypothetical protein
MQKPNEVCRLRRALRIFLIAGATVVLGQAQNPPAANPNRTVGPQKDGSVVASDNQALTPAGKIIELGSPVRAKAIALNPNGKTNSGAVLLMGSPQPIIVFNTATGQVLQRFIPSFMKGEASTSSKAECRTAWSTSRWPPLSQCEIHQPGRYRSFRRRQARLCGPERD